MFCVSLQTALVREAEKDDQQPYMPFTTDIDMVSRRKKYIVIRKCLLYY